MSGVRHPKLKIIRVKNMNRIIDNEDAYLNTEMALRDQADEPEVDESEPNDLDDYRDAQND